MDFQAGKRCRIKAVTAGRLLLDFVRLKARPSVDRVRRTGSTMNSKNGQHLVDRVTRAAEASLAAQGYVAPLDVLLGIGWL